MCGRCYVSKRLRGSWSVCSVWVVVALWVVVTWGCIIGAVVKAVLK